MRIWVILIEEIVLLKEVESEKLIFSNLNLEKELFVLWIFSAENFTAFNSKNKILNHPEHSLFPSLYTYPTYNWWKPISKKLFQYKNMK